MKAIAEIQILPTGSEESVQEEVARANQILSSSGLKTEVHAMGTDIEGELEEVFRALKRIHEQLHDCGVGRLSTVIKLGTRDEKERGERLRGSKAKMDAQTSAASQGMDSFVTVWQMATPAR